MMSIDFLHLLFITIGRHDIQPNNINKLFRNKGLTCRKESFIKTVKI